MSSNTPLSGFANVLTFCVCVVLLLLVYSYLTSVVYASTSKDTTVTASLTVNTFVDTSMNQTSISFGSLDPATSGNPASQNPIGLTNTANSNTVIDIYLNNTNMTNGSNFIPYYNLSVNTVNNNLTAKRFNYTTYINGTSANGGFVENLAVSSTTSLYFWHDVPPGQTAGAYSANVTVHSVANGQTP